MCPKINDAVMPLASIRDATGRPRHEMNMGGPKNTIPMMTGTGPFGPIAMGGMFTILKIREGITSYDDPGWFKHPEGTVAGPVDS